jgi:hypothetical protein
MKPETTMRDITYRLENWTVDYSPIVHDSDCKEAAREIGKLRRLLKRGESMTNPQTTTDEDSSITLTIVQGGMTLSCRLGEAAKREEVVEACDTLLAALYGSALDVGVLT